MERGQEPVSLIPPILLPRDILRFLAGNATNQELDALGSAVFLQKQQGLLAMLRAMVEINSLDLLVTTREEREGGHRVSATAASDSGEMLSLTDEMDH